MEAIPRKYGEWGQFDRYCKLVLYHEAIDYLREMKCRRDREVSLFASLPKDEQSILILRFVLDLTDEEIGRLMGMSRSAVQRHRTSTLKDLRIKLMAFMPEGG